MTLTAAVLACIVLSSFAARIEIKSQQDLSTETQAEGTDTWWFGRRRNEENSTDDQAAEAVSGSDNENLPEAESTGAGGWWPLRTSTSNSTTDDDDGDACASISCRFRSLMAHYASEGARLEDASSSWPAPPAMELEKPLLAAKLCQASYEPRATVEEVVAAENMTLLEYTERWYITSRQTSRRSRWWSSRSSAEEVWVIFRGTADLQDVLADVLVRPTEYNGAMWHTGFLEGVQKPELQAALRQHANSPHVTVVGHSLGGAQAFALAASDLMPVGHIEEVITFGAPAAIFEESHDSVRSDFKHIAFVNKADPVPRLLGQDASVLKTVLGLWQVRDRSVEEGSGNLFDAIAKYAQKGDTVWLKGSEGKPHIVPQSFRSMVMHLQTVLSLFARFRNPLGDHLMAGYRAGIENEVLQAN